MTPIVAFVAAAATTALGWLLCRKAYSAPVLQRTNFRGEQVPVGGGVILACGVVAIEAGWRTLEIADLVDEPTGAVAAVRASALIATLGFGLLGLFDDLAAQGDTRGFKGHVRSMFEGSLTTGGLKLAVGGVLSVLVVAGTGPNDLVALVVGSFLVALAANLGNLLDRAPGRTTKVGLIVGVVLLLLTPAAERGGTVGAAMVVGAAVGLLIPDLRERLMLGDAGSNVVGAALGLSVVSTTSVSAQLVAVAALLVLNAASEVVSFSRVIESVPPLRFLDRLGRRR